MGHVQKRMGTAFRELKKQHRRQKLSDGKTIGDAGRLTESVIYSLQNNIMVTLFKDTLVVFQER